MAKKESSLTTVGMEIAKMPIPHHLSLLAFLEQHPDRVFFKKDLMKHFGVSDSSIKSWSRKTSILHINYKRNKHIYGCQRAIEAAKKRLGLSNKGEE